MFVAIVRFLVDMETKRHNRQRRKTKQLSPRRRVLGGDNPNATEYSSEVSYYCFENALCIGMMIDNIRLPGGDLEQGVMTMVGPFRLLLFLEGKIEIHSKNQMSIIF